MRERENGEIERKAKKLKQKTEAAACLETAIKFSIDSLCPKFIHLSMHLSLRVTEKNLFYVQECEVR